MSSRQVGFWDFEDRLRDLSAHGDPLLAFGQRLRVGTPVVDGGL